MKRNYFKATVERLAALEQAWHGRHFLAPVLAPGRARLRLEGLLFEVGVQPREFNGFGVFTMRGPGHAELLRPATPREREQYFELWPRLPVRMLLKAAEQAWLAWPVGGMQATRPLLVGAVSQTIAPFEMAEVGYDGVRAWYRNPVLNTDVRLAEQLAEALERGVRPADLRLRGLTPPDRQAYSVIHAWRFGPELPASSLVERHEGSRGLDPDAVRLRRALQKGGGELRSFGDADAGWNVHWVDSTGQAHFSLVRPSDLTVVSSGICLSGRDSDFDLTSLVGVVEGQ